MKIFCSYLFSLLLVSCASKNTSQPQRIILEDSLNSIQYKNKEANIAVLGLGKNAHCSIHKIKLKGAEAPHTHEKHDLMVYVLSGQSRVHFKNKQVDLQVGDFISIPKGVYHWAENVGKTDAEVLVVFSPPFDGKDTIPVSK